MKLFDIAARNIGRNKRRSILSGLAIAIAAMSIVMLFSLINGLRADLRYNLETYYSGEIRIRHPEFGRYELINPLHLNVANPDGYIAELRDMEGVEAVSPRVNLVTALYKNDVRHNSRAVGIDFAREGEFQDLDRILLSGRMPEAGRNEAAVATGLAYETGLSVGDSFTVQTMTVRRATNAFTFEVTGIVAFPVAALNTTTYLIPIDRAQDLAKMPDAASEILVKLDDGVRADRFAASLRDGGFGSGGLEIRSITEIPSTYQLMDIADRTYQIVGIVFFILASTVIITTTMMVIFERMREIGTLGAMGMTGPEIVRLFFLESLMIAVMGALAGIALGVVLSLVLSVTGIDLQAAFEGVDFEISGVIYTKLELGSTLLVFVYALAVSSVASILPSRRAAKIEPVEALRTVN